MKSLTTKVKSLKKNERIEIEATDANYNTVIMIADNHIMGEFLVGSSNNKILVVRFN